eukprot:g83007.t1
MGRLNRRIGRIFEFVPPFPFVGSQGTPSWPSSFQITLRLYDIFTIVFSTSMFCGAAPITCMLPFRVSSTDNLKTVALTLKQLSVLHY